MKKNNYIDSKRIRVGKITYFDADNNGSLVPPISAYVFMLQFGNLYINPFDLASDYPVYDRVPYSNCTRDGLEYGTKIKHVQGEIKNGPCIVLEKVDFSEHYGEDKMSLKSLGDIMIGSNKFFVDRLNVLEDRNVGLIIKGSIRKKILEDKINHRKLNDFIDKCESEKEEQYIK